MKLSEVKWNMGETVISDCEFGQLGYLKSGIPGGLLAFYDNPKFTRQLSNPDISCIICRKGLEKKLPEHIKGIVLSDDPVCSFWKLHNDRGSRKKYEKTEIGDACEISRMACIADHNVKIGNHVVIEEFVSVKENTVIGDNVIIRAGSVVGGTGLCFKQMEDVILPVEHYGGVIIEDNVEIQQHASVHKSVFPWDNTIICEGTKIGDYVHIGHACKIGVNCMIAGKALICGSSFLGNSVWIGPGAVIKNGVDIGSNAYVALGSVIRKNVGEKMAAYENRIMSIDKFNAINRLAAEQ